MSRFPAVHSRGSRPWLYRPPLGLMQLNKLQNGGAKIAARRMVVNDRCAGLGNNSAATGEQYSAPWANPRRVGMAYGAPKGRSDPAGEADGRSGRKIWARNRREALHRRLSGIGKTGKTIGVRRVA